MHILSYPRQQSPLCGYQFSYLAYTVLGCPMPRGFCAAHDRGAVRAVFILSGAGWTGSGTNIWKARPRTA